MTGHKQNSSEVSTNDVVESQKATGNNDLDNKIAQKVENLDLPKKEKQRIIAKMEMYSGPIPHPDILAGYQKLYPKAAERIIENGIEESQHRRDLETARQRRRGRLAWLSLAGQIVILIIFVVCSFLLIFYDHKIVGSIFGGVSFLGMIGILGNVSELTKNTDLNSEDNKE